VDWLGSWCRCRLSHAVYCHQSQLPAARQSQDRRSLRFRDKEIRARPLSVLVFAREGDDTKLLYCGAIARLQYGLSFLRSSLCWICVGGQFFGEHSAEYTERENVSLCSCVDLYSQGRRALVLDVQTGVKFVTVVTAVLLDGREFKAFQSAGNIIIAVVGDGVNSLAAMSGAAG